MRAPWLLASMMAAGPFGDTGYTPAMPAMAKALPANYGMVQFTIAVNARHMGSVNDTPIVFLALPIIAAVLFGTDLAVRGKPPEAASR